MWKIYHSIIYIKKSFFITHADKVFETIAGYLPNPFKRIR